MFNEIQAYLNRKEYKKNIELSKNIAILSELLFKDNEKEYNRLPHPLMEIKKKEFSFHASQVLPDKKPVHINFGDSLTDLSRKQLTCINGIYSISGSWSHHIYEMIKFLVPIIYNREINVEKVSIGCLIGNPLLAYQNYKKAMEDAMDTLNYCRLAFNNSKMIVYGMPPVYNLHATENTLQVDYEFSGWCKTHEAVFISLRNEFGKGWKKFFPDLKYSSDGVHFNPAGAEKFNNMLKNA